MQARLYIYNCRSWLSTTLRPSRVKEWQRWNESNDKRKEGWQRPWTIDVVKRYHCSLALPHDSPLSSLFVTKLSFWNYFCPHVFWFLLQVLLVKFCRKWRKTLTTRVSAESRSMGPLHAVESSADLVEILQHVNLLRGRSPVFFGKPHSPHLWLSSSIWSLAPFYLFDVCS